MIKEYTERPHDTKGIDHILGNPFCALFMDMGLGKTAISLTALKDLLYNSCEVYKVLIIAPLEVAKNVWTDEIETWNHLHNHLKIVKILGTEIERKIAMRTKARIHIINVDNLAWLVAQYGLAWPFDMVVIDESSCFKSEKSIRFNAMLSMVELDVIKRMVLLSGTPIPNGLIDIWPQIFLLDRGQRLGPSKEAFLESYFIYDQWSYKYRPRPPMGNYKGAEREIYDLIGDICISMQGNDLKGMPKNIIKDIKVHLPEKIKAQYKKFERDLVLALFDREDLTVDNARELSNKLLQFTNGAVYDELHTAHTIHDCKLDALEEFIFEAQGKNVLVIYNFQSDWDRLKRRFPHIVKLKEKGAKQRWNEGEIPLMGFHPKSGGHGQNLQFGGSFACWFGLNWGLELYDQANKRLARPGLVIDDHVTTGRLICPGTIDDQVSLRLALKQDDQNAMLTAIKAIYKEHKK